MELEYKLYIVHERDVDDSEYNEFIKAGISIDELHSFVKNNIDKYKENIKFIIIKDNKEVSKFYKYYNNLIIGSAKEE